MLPPALDRFSPPVARLPEWAGGDGALVVDLCEMAGLRLDHWQQAAVHVAFARRPDGMLAARTVGVSVPRQNGKGAIIEACELGWLFVEQVPLILHSAHEFKTSREAFLRLVGLIEDTPELAAEVESIDRAHGNEGISLRTGPRLKYAARSKGSGRGFSAPRLVLDESYALTDDQVAAMLPTMSAQRDAQILYTSTPPLEGGGPFVALRSSALKGDPSRDRTAWLEWSPPAGFDLDDPEVWALANPAFPHRMTIEAIAAERAGMSEAAFRRERLGEWPADASGAAIPSAAWAACRADGSSIAGAPWLAIDVPPDRSSVSIGAAGWTATGLLHVELIECRRGTGWAVDEIVRLVQRHRVRAVVVDPGGPAGALLADLERAGVPTTTVGARQVAQACGALHDAAVEGRLVHLGQPLLDAAAAAATRRSLGDAWAWHRSSAEVDIAPLYAVTLAAFAARAEDPHYSVADSILT